MPDEKPPTFNPNIPTVTSLNSYVLERNGWARKGSEYSKDGITVRYDGVCWWVGKERVQFLEDLKKK